MKKLLFLSLVLCSLLITACSPAPTADTITTTLTQVTNTINNYHSTITVADYKMDTSTTIPHQQSIMNIVFLQNVGGYGSRIDKTNGIVKNQTEVITNGTQGVIKYHQQNWETTITPSSAFNNINIYPYEKISGLLAKLTPYATIQQNLQELTITYDGADTTVLNLFEQYLEFPAQEHASVTLKATVQLSTNYIKQVQIIYTQNDTKNEKHIDIAYSGFNEQHAKEIPVINN